MLKALCTSRSERIDRKVVPTYPILPYHSARTHFLRYAKLKVRFGLRKGPDPQTWGWCNSHDDGRYIELLARPVLCSFQRYRIRACESELPNIIPRSLPGHVFAHSIHGLNELTKYGMGEKGTQYWQVPTPTPHLLLRLVHFTKEFGNPHGQGSPALIKQGDATHGTSAS